MAQRSASSLLVVAMCVCGMFALQTAFLAPNEQRTLRGCTQDQGTIANVAAVSVAAGLPEAAHAKLPDEFVIFAPIVDVLPTLPIFFLLLAFLWQASVGFR